MYSEHWKLILLPTPACKTMMSGRRIVSRTRKRGIGGCQPESSIAWTENNGNNKKDATLAWQKALQEHQAEQFRWVDEKKGWELERRNAELERAQWARERTAREDRYRLDAGNTLGVFWEHIESHHCVGHGIREYTATVGFNADNACAHLPITVNGKMFTAPQECRREGDAVVSRWSVNVGEASCKLYWGDLSDKGCVGWERRRFEAHLLGLDRGMDRMNMCRSTPIDISGQHFDQPGECRDTGWTVFGIWEAYDTACH